MVGFCRYRIEGSSRYDVGYTIGRDFWRQGYATRVVAALLVELTRALGPNPTDAAAIALGRLTSHIMVLRRLSRSVAGMLQNGHNPALQASLVKDLGALVEQEIPEIARQLIDAEPDERSTQAFSAVLAHTMMHAPSFSLRGGAREILRGIIARGLGLRELSGNAPNDR